MTREAAHDVASAKPRHPIRTTGRIEAVHVIRTRDSNPGSPARIRVECELDDGTGCVWLVFYGRYEIPGIETGVLLTVEGVVVPSGGRLTLLNPLYRFEPDKADEPEEFDDPEEADWLFGEGGSGGGDPNSW
jgi:hypothetical protein